MLVKSFIVLSTFSLFVFGQECTTSLAGLGYQCMKNTGNGPNYKAKDETQFCCGLINGVLLEDTWTCHTSDKQLDYGTCCAAHSTKNIKGYVQMGEKHKNISITKCKDGKITFGQGCKMRFVPCDNKKCVQVYDCP